MNYKSITIISIIVTAIFVMPLFSFTGDGTVPGVPFQVLQNQIDNLKEQINDLELENVSVEAFTTTTGMVSQIHHELPAYEEVDLLTLELPAGKYVSNITLQAYYIPYSTNLNCGYVDSSGQSIGSMFGGNVSGQVSHAHTMGMQLLGSGPLTVTVRCSHCPMGGTELLDINHAEWTVIAVDELDYQESIPALSP